MSLILEGIDLPKGAEETTVKVFSDGRCSIVRTKEGECYELEFNSEAQAIQIPPDHGDIIDRSKVFTYSYWDEIELNEVEPLLKREVIPDE